jgi:flagellar biosynthesis protein FliQ
VSEADAIDVSQSAIWAIVLMSAPIVGPAMLVGIAVAFGQALTQIQENTLTFVPKMLVVFFALMYAANYIGGHLQLVTQELYGKVETGFPVLE